MVGKGLNSLNSVSDGPESSYTGLLSAKCYKNQEPRLLSLLLFRNKNHLVLKTR